MNQTNPTNPNSTKPHTKGVAIFSSIISYLSVPFFAINVSLILTLIIKAMHISNGLDELGVGVISSIIVLIPLTIFWLVVCIKMTEKISQGSKKALIILLIISSFFIITGNLIIFSNR